MEIIETNRLILRTWQDTDVKIMTKINQDPQVMKYFPKLQDRTATAIFVSQMISHFSDYGYCLYACTLKTSQQLIGFIGLKYISQNFKAPFAPATEIGWRLDSNFWHQGLATEGATAVMNYAFNQLKIAELVSMTAAINQPSRRLMTRIGLQYHQSDDFNYPSLPANHRLAPHVLYRLKRDENHDPKRPQAVVTY